MTTGVPLLPKLHFDDTSGANLSSGQLFVYLAGTTTPATTYSDAALTQPNPNPIILDSRGEAVVFADPTVLYKLVLAQSVAAGGGIIWSVDNVPFGTGPGTNVITGLSTVGGTANALTLTTQNGPSLSDGTMLEFYATSTNTGPTTINYNGTGNKNARKNSGELLTGGELVQNRPYFALYHASNDSFYLDPAIVQNPAVRTIGAATYTVSQADHGQVLVFTNVAPAVTLPAASTLSVDFNVTVQVVTGSLLSFTGTIDGVASPKVAGGGVLRVGGDGSVFRGWWLANATDRQDVASAATVDLRQLVTGTKYPRITGTTTITAITLSNGELVDVTFSGALTLTNGASFLNPGGSNILTTAGDAMRVVGESGAVARVVSFTGNTNLAFIGGRKKTVNYITVSGSYTKPTTGLDYVEAEVVGGGGGGGVVAGAGIGTGGGGYGGYGKRKIPAASLAASEVVTIGAAGAAGGGVGGTTSFGAWVSATGGAGGNTANGTGKIAQGGDPGSASSGNINAAGQAGMIGAGSAIGNSGTGWGGSGGSGPFGVGGASTTGDGNSGTGFGSGGSGCYGTGGINPRAGQPGLCVVTEYYL